MGLPKEVTGLLTRRGHVRRGQLLRGRGGREGALQVHRLVEQFVTDEDDQGKEAELEVVDFDWGLCFIGADDEEREENGEQTAAGRKSTRQVVLQTLNIII